MNRDEHLKWAKDRALEYADAGDPGNAIASLTSDLAKHPDLAGFRVGPVLILDLLTGKFDEPGALRSVIEALTLLRPIYACRPRRRRQSPTRPRSTAPPGHRKFGGCFVHVAVHGEQCRTDSCLKLTCALTHLRVDEPVLTYRCECRNLRTNQHRPDRRGGGCQPPARRLP